MMRRRDRQNEVLVAIIVIVAMAFAFVFSILLSLGNEEARQEATAIPAPNTEPPPTREIAIPPSSSPTLSTTSSPTPTDTPTLTASPSLTATLTHTPTVTPSATATDTPSQPPTATASNTPSDTPRATETLTLTSEPSATRTPSRTPRPSRTPTTTPSDTPRPTQTTVERQASPTHPTATPTPCQPLSNWEVYTVDRGQTFFSIARAAGLTVEELAQANCLTNPERILAGQTLRIPPGTTINEVIANDAATQDCASPNGQLLAPQPGESLDGSVQLIGIADGPDFRRYVLSWGADRPDRQNIQYQSFAEEFTPVPSPGPLGEFPSDAFEPGLYWFQLLVMDSRDRELGLCAIRVRFR
ncbi:MAG: LysM peptidoglycan-binding domain-containing protein [Anaerolineales bacterium]